MRQQRVSSSRPNQNLPSFTNRYYGRYDLRAIRARDYLWLSGRTHNRDEAVRGPEIDAHDGALLFTEINLKCRHCASGERFFNVSHEILYIPATV